MKKNYKKKTETSHATGRVISITEMLHSMLKYSEIAIDLNFICIHTTPLEFRKSHKIMNADINNDEYVNNFEGGINVGNIST